MSSRREEAASTTDCGRSLPGIHCIRQVVATDGPIAPLAIAIAFATRNGDSALNLNILIAATPQRRRGINIRANAVNKSVPNAGGGLEVFFVLSPMERYVSLSGHYCLLALLGQLQRLDRRTYCVWLAGVSQSPNLFKILTCCKDAELTC